MTFSKCSVVALLAAATGLAACGGSSSDQPSVLTPASLANIASKTTAKGGVRMSMDQTTSLGSGGSIPISAVGLFDSKSKRGEMTMTMDLSSVPGGESLPSGANKQHVILDGFKFYMSSPLFASELPAGKKWLKIDLAKIGKSVGIDFNALTRGAGQDPTQALQYLKAASGDVTKVGTETVRGASTTRYKATIDFDKVADAAPAGQRDAIRRSMKQITKLAGTSTAPMEVWIGDDGTVRRMTDKIATNIGGRHSTTTQRIELYDFGTKVDVKIPSASETVDASDLGGSGSGSSSGSGGLSG
ncbi:MAG: hypothetical protein QOE11_1648 [Solirubrobacteraceae bacterium]|nr:hypothetical protein [Solirubrobacteraceae bacterium]